MTGALAAGILEGKAVSGTTGVANFGLQASKLSIVAVVDISLLLDPRGSTSPRSTSRSPSSAPQTTTAQAVSEDSVASRATPPSATVSTSGPTIGGTHQQPTSHPAPTQPSYSLPPPAVTLQTPSEDTLVEPTSGSAQSLPRVQTQFIQQADIQGVSPNIQPQEGQETGGVKLFWPSDYRSASTTSQKRGAPDGTHPLEPVAKKQSKWTPEENSRIIELRGGGMKWEDISKRLPGRSAISCRLHYQNFLERRPEWDEEKKTKLARLYERFKQGMWDPIAKELHMPWRAAEAMHWQLGSEGMARRAGVPVFSTASQHPSQPITQRYEAVPSSGPAIPPSAQSSYAPSPTAHHGRPLQPLLQRPQSPTTSAGQNQPISKDSYHYPLEQVTPAHQRIYVPPHMQHHQPSQHPLAPAGPRRSISTNNMYTVQPAQISPRRRAFSATRASGTLPAPELHPSGARSAHPGQQHEHDKQLRPPGHSSTQQSSSFKNGNGGSYGHTQESEHRRASAGDESNTSHLKQQRNWPPPPIKLGAQDQPRMLPPMRTVEEAVDEGSPLDANIRSTQSTAPQEPDPQLQQRPPLRESSRSKSNGHSHQATAAGQKQDTGLSRPEDSGSVS